MKNQEYYKDLETTKMAFSEDGWFKTGDLAYYDKNKNVYIVERIKALIKVEGTKVKTFLVFFMKNCQN